MGFKEYLNESLIVEAKVKVGGKEYASKKDAGIALAKQGKNEFQIERMTGLSSAGARWCYLQAKKSSGVDLKAVKQKEKYINQHAEYMTKGELARNKKDLKNLNKPKDDDKKKDLLNKLKDELKNAESESKGKLNSGDAYVLTLKRKIKELEEKPKDDNKNELKAVRKELQSYGKEYDRLETLIRKLRDKGEVFEMHKAERRLKELEDKMQTLHGKEQDLIG